MPIQKTDQVFAYTGFVQPDGEWNGNYDLGVMTLNDNFTIVLKKDLKKLEKEHAELRKVMEDCRVLIQDQTIPIGNKLQEVSSRFYFALEGKK